MTAPSHALVELRISPLLCLRVLAPKALNGPWVFVGIFLAFLTAAEPASATPTSGLIYQNYVEAIDLDVKNHARIDFPGPVDDEDQWSVRSDTRSPSTFVFQDLTFLPGAHTGWHSHPGQLLVTVAEGSIEWYDVQCTKHLYKTGDFFTENDQSHYVRNVQAVNARVMITFVIARGHARRTDLSAPACGKALGLE